MRTLADEQKQLPAPHRIAPPRPDAMPFGLMMRTVVALQRTVGNSAVTRLVRDHRRSVNSPVALFEVQRCGPSHPCSCPQDRDAEDTAQGQATIQRACDKATGTWKYEYDGCSLPARGSLSILSGSPSQPLITLGGTSKDNPTGAEGTEFALHKPTTQGGVACDRHDECYQSCTTSKDECDRRMHDDMKAICGAAPMQVKQKCFMYALAYYQGLNRLPQAQKAFDKRKADVCKCDPTSTPPHKCFPARDLLWDKRRGGWLGWLQYRLMTGRPPLLGYKEFRSEEEYQKYIHGGTEKQSPPVEWKPSPSFPIPSRRRTSLRMR